MGFTRQKGTDDRTARDDVEFLVSSWNRVDVLEAVATTPRSRDELRDIADVSRVTLSRILSDLEAQGWVTREDDRYRATRAGRVIASELTRLLANVRALNHLGENISWIRVDQFEFDLSHLEDAELITPTWDDFSAQTSALVDLVSECTRIRGVGTGIDREFVKAVGDATVDGDLSVELVFVPAVVGAISDEPELARRFRDLADAEDAAIYRYEGREPVMEMGLNETSGDRENVVMLCGEHDEGAPPGTVKTTDSAVWEWAESYFDTRRAESCELRAAAFTA